jgi:hypothetical protein
MTVPADAGGGWRTTRSRRRRASKDSPSDEMTVLCDVIVAGLPADLKQGRPDQAVREVVVRCLQDLAECPAVLRPELAARLARLRLSARGEIKPRFIRRQ